MIGGQGRRSLLFSIVHLYTRDGEGGAVVTQPTPHRVRDRVEELGGTLYAITSEGLGAVFSLELKLSS